MKVMLVNGSPRENGCTFTALSEISKELNLNGIETEIMQIGKSAIRGCTACRGCKKTNRCIFDDDIANEIIAKAENCDGFIFGSPVYYASANGSLISLMDRLFYAGGKNFAHKPAAAIASARRAGTTVTIDEINKYFSIAQMPIISSTYWNMVHGNTPDEVLKDLEGLQTMRNLGKNMAWILKCIDIGKKNGIDIPQAEREYTTNFIR